MRSPLVALAASLTTAAAVSTGFNYGSTKTDGSFRFQQDFEDLFKTAKGLVGTSGFSSARLYTMIQGGSYTNEPTQAIPAAIAQDTTLLLGLWASGGDGPFAAEITALKSAVATWGSSFTSRVVGISVGSEDLYRISPTGIAAKSGYGANPATLASYISQLKAYISSVPGLSGVPVGHVDTWTAWVNGSNQAVIDASDWIGMDAYPYFQNSMPNGIENGKALFNDALGQTKNAVGGKPVWITETGWPATGKTEGAAVPSIANAKTYWDEVGCPLFGTTNTWWFTLEDTDKGSTNPSFGITSGNPLSTTPLFDLSCKAGSTPSSGSGTPTPSSSSVASSASSGGGVASSASSVVVPTSPLASSGGGLSPSQGAGNGINPSVTGSGPAPTSASSGGSGGSSGNATVPSGGAAPTVQTSVKPTGTATTTGPAVAGTNAANLLSGSVAGVVGALVVAIAAL